MNFEELMSQRYSARSFQSRPVAAETIKKMFALAQHTPSWCNTQPWHAWVTMTPQITENLRVSLMDHIVGQGAMLKPDESFPPRYIEPYRQRRKECGVALYQSIGIRKEDKPASMRQMLENFNFFGAPHVAFIFCHKMFGFYGGVDCGLYIHALLLAAENFGLRATAQGALASYPQFIRDYWGIDDSLRMICGISFGYADEEHSINTFRTSRAPLEESVTWIED